LKKCIITGMVEGTRGKGRPRTASAMTPRIGQIYQQKSCCSRQRIMQPERARMICRAANARNFAPGHWRRRWQQRSNSKSSCVYFTV